MLLGNAGLIRRPSKPSSSNNNAAAAAAQRLADQKAANELRLKKLRNEGEVAKRMEEVKTQKERQTAETAVDLEQRKEKEKMLRTFSTRTKGRKALRINIGDGSGSSYEGSSGISINI